MSDKNKYDKQIEIFHKEIVELVKKYQFRDRNQVICCGVSVSQCYILETLNTYGSMNVQDLADKMHLKISTITRVLDQLVKKEFVTRIQDPKDMRYRLVELTKEGRKIHNKLWSTVFASEKAIFDDIEPENREVVLDLLRKLNCSLTRQCSYL
ncbi:MAG: MarR family transcriptional regulator [bacterium]|nr:MarR family transcriptional regulator [bacterium]